MDYSFVTPKSFEKELSKLAASARHQFDKQLHLLEHDPHYNSLHSHPVGKTKEGEQIWSSSVNMSCRFTWLCHEKSHEILLRHIGKHDIYRSP